MNWVKPRMCIYIYIYPGILVSRGVKNKISIDREVSKRCWWLNSSMYRGTRWASIKKTESSEIWLDISSYVSGGIEKNPENLEIWNFKGETTWNECKQDKHHTKHQSSMLSTQTQQNLWMQSIPRSINTKKV